MRRTVVALILFWLAAMPCPAPAVAADEAGDVEVVYENEYVTCHASNVSLVGFLEALSLEAELQFIFAEPPDPALRVSVDFDRKPLNEVARILLKGYNYAVVFNISGANQPLLVSYAAYNSRSTDGKVYENPDAVDPNPVIAKRESMEQEIEALQERIDSGEADREYEKWATIRGAQYVVHDSDRIEACQEQIEKLDAEL